MFTMMFHVLDLRYGRTVHIVVLRMRVVALWHWAVWLQEALLLSWVRHTYTGWG